MTLIKPLSHLEKKRFLIFVILTIVIFGILYIYQYNDFSNLRYKKTILKSKIDEVLKTQNELKSQLFSITDPKNFTDFAKKNNLVVETKPKYLIVKKWVSGF
jgi:cell division protein FtsL